MFTRFPYNLNNCPTLDVTYRKRTLFKFKYTQESKSRFGTFLDNKSSSGYVIFVETACEPKLLEKEGGKT